MTDGVRVTGSVSAEEVAAVLAVLQAATSSSGRGVPADAYARWRRGRLAAVRPRSPRG